MLRSFLSCAGVLFFLLAGPAWSAGSCERLVATGNPEYPPYLWRNPDNPAQLMGANAELLKRIGRALDIEVDVIYTGSWARAQDEARSGRVDMLAGAFVTQARVEYMDYVHPPFLHTDSVVWVRRGQELFYAGRQDLQGLKGGTLVNNSFGEDFDRYAQQHLSIEAVPSIAQAMRKLLLGRTDYVLYEQYPGTAIAQSLGFAEELDVLQPAISSEGLHFTLSHNSACNTARLRGQLARSLMELRASGVADRVLQDSLALWQSQQVQQDSLLLE